MTFIKTCNFGNISTFKYTHYKKYKIKIIRQRFNKKSVSNLWRKRTFEDGKIDWRMSKETIINLVDHYPILILAHIFYIKKGYQSI